MKHKLDHVITLLKNPSIVCHSLQENVKSGDRDDKALCDSMFQVILTTIQSMIYVL